MSKFTFKRHAKETGLRGVGNPYPQVDIKLNKKVVGTIVPPCWSSKDMDFIIRFMVEDYESNIGWKWIQLKYRAPSEQHAREFIEGNYETLQSKYKFLFDE